MIPQVCPKCAVNLNYEDNGVPSSYAIGVQVRGVFDGVLFWQCPFCDHQWPRFAFGDRLHDEAVRLINRN